MSRFVTGPAPTDAWNHIPDRVVLPPLAMDNNISQPRRQSVASPSSYSNGAYPFTNTFDQPRPPTASSSGVGSPGLSAVQEGASYRRPSLTSRSQSAMSRNGAISPLVPDLNGRVYQDPQAMNWSAPDSRPSTATYNSYTDNSYADFSNGLTQDNNPPQSPSFSFAPSAFPNQQHSVYINPRSSHGLTLAQAAALASQPTPSPSNASSLGIDATSGAQQALEDELAQLRTKVRELEFVNDLVQLRVVELENEKVKVHQGQAQSATRGIGAMGMPAPSSEFQASWDARTEARIKRFCSLNRAGNALCAWHDSRRERRAYPPRMAPPGTLNCGCTFEEALFEESLSRHRVGSYLPGEMVRMDPALRNPLLSLLQWRYGYKDGDFERDPESGLWVEGEGEQLWQARAAAGGSNSRRHRTEDGST